MGQIRQPKIEYYAKRFRDMRDKAYETPDYQVGFYDLPGGITQATVFWQNRDFTRVGVVRVDRNHPISIINVAAKQIGDIDDIWSEPRISRITTALFHTAGEGLSKIEPVNAYPARIQDSTVIEDSISTLKVALGAYASADVYTSATRRIIAGRILLAANRISSTP